MKTIDDFIPIHEYQKSVKKAKQNIYRWIREKKFDDNDIRIDEILVKRIRIRRGALPKLLK